MSANIWNHAQYLHHKVRNMVRRGYLKKTYYDKKILQARVITGVENENDRLEVMQPVGYLGRVKPGDKVEILTMDIGGDPSRRVVLHVIGDREHHPKVDEGEAALYTPGDKKKFVRVRKGSDGGDEDAPYGENKRKGAIETDADDLPIQTTTKDAQSTKTDKGIGNDTKGNFTVKASSNTQFTAAKHIQIGEAHREGETFVEGKHHAKDHLAGGGTSVSEAATFATGSKREDGSKNWSAEGKPGTVSLLATAASLQQFQQDQSESNDQTADQIKGLEDAVQEMAQQQSETNADLAGRVASLESRMAALEGRVAALESSP